MKKTITFLSKRAAMMLLATLLLTLTAQTAWAQDVVYYYYSINLAFSGGSGTVTMDGLEDPLIEGSNSNVGEIIGGVIDCHLHIKPDDGYKVSSVSYSYYQNETAGGGISGPHDCYMDGTPIDCTATISRDVWGDIDYDNLTFTVNVVFEQIDYSIHVDVQGGPGTVIINNNYVTGGGEIHNVTPRTIIQMTTMPVDGFSISSVTGSFPNFYGDKVDLDIRLPENGYEFTYPDAQIIKWDNPVVTVNIVFSPINYNITYNLDGGTNDSGNPDSYNIESGIVELKNPTKTGYTFDGWYDNENFGGERIYNFIADNDYDLHYLQNREFWAKWTANTYTVHFDANGGSGTMADMNLTYDGDWATLTAFGFTAPEGKAFKNWNTADDGSGASYDNEEWVRNLTTENGATVTLYAQWGKDISTCTAEVPDQSKKYRIIVDNNENLNDVTSISYKFDDANTHPEVAEQVGAVVKDGNKTLILGTDYRFGRVTMANGDEIPHTGSKVDDECRVEIEGMGDYAGSKWAYFMVTTPDAADTWGDLAWSFHAGTLTITGTGAMNPTSRDQYPWFSIANYIKTVTLSEGITSIAASAFAGTQNVHSYGNLTTINLPNSLTEIGENAFAYCVGLSIDLADLNGIEYPASAFSYIGSITGTLYDKADNSKAVTMMWQAGTNNVTITDRTLYKDGYWNTICLPFDVKADNALLTGATVKELDLNGYYDDKRTGFDEQSGSLYLFFQTPTADGNGVLLKAGTPYLIKWPSGENSTSDLTFNGVKVISSPLNITSKDNKVSFIGNFSPVTLKGGDASNLYIGIGKNAQNEDVNKLYWPSTDKTINSFRAYFTLDNPEPGGSGAPDLKIVLNFGEDENTTAINEHESHESHELSGAWYSLDGRKLDGKPTQKGIYIYNGKKIIK